MTSTKIFKDIDVLKYSIVDMEDENVKEILERYKKQIVVLPEANYTDDILYIPEFAIKFDDIVCKEHVNIDFKYILGLNNRIFVLIQSCFCGRNTKEFNLSTDINTLKKLKLVKDEDGDDLLVIPEIEMPMDNLIDCKYINEYRIKSSWLVSVYIKLQEIFKKDDKEDVDVTISNTEDETFHISDAVSNIVSNFCN